jgi:hypothetical protein
MKKKSVILKIIGGCILSNFDNSNKTMIHIRFELT